jgi:hypothetical protein
MPFSPSVRCFQFWVAVGFRDPDESNFAVQWQMMIDPSTKETVEDDDPRHLRSPYVKEEELGWGYHMVDLYRTLL